MGIHNVILLYRISRKAILWPQELVFLLCKQILFKVFLICKARSFDLVISGT